MQNRDVMALPIIDREQFDMLVETGEDTAPGLIQELLDLFIEESDPRMKSLPNALRAGDLTQMAKDAHAIAGSAANLGAYRLSQLCRALENSVTTKNRGYFRATIRQIRQEYKRAISTFKKEIAAIGR